MSFKQLIDYLDKDENLDRHTWNMYADKLCKEEVVNEFMQNAEYIKEAKGRVFMYHEVLSLEKNELDFKRQKEILFDLANEYVKQRASEHLVYGSVHNDTHNLHIHLIISSNKAFANKRTRLSKNQFASIQSDIQNYKNISYKELNRTSHYKKTKDLSKSRQKEQEIKHQRNKQTTKEYIKENLQKIFDNTTSKEYLHNAMKSESYAFYSRGKTTGIKYNGKSYRLKTLGMDDSYRKVLNRVEKVKSREVKRSEFKNSTKRRDFGRSTDSKSTNNTSRSR